MVQQELGLTGRKLARPVTRAATGGYRVVTKDFDVRVEEVEVLDGPPDFVTTFPATQEGFIAAQDEAIAYLEDVIADCLETLKDLKDARWVNATELARALGN